MLDQLRELTLPEVRDRLESRIDALIGRAVDNDDMRSEDEISRGIVRALRDDLPMQCHDLALNAAAVRDGLNAHASSYIHAKVGLATSYEMALDLASKIENIVVPDHVIDVCTRNRSLCLEFDRLTHRSPRIGQSHEFEGPDLGGLGL